MLDRMDDLVKRFVAVFVIPLINIVAFGSILYVCTKQNVGDIFSSTNLVNFVSFILNLFSTLIKDSFDSILKFAKDYSKEIQSLTFFVLAVAVIVVVMLMYAFERFIFIFGKVMPPGFEFDVETYARYSGLFVGSDRVKLLSKVLGPEVESGKSDGLPLRAAYGTLRAYLGERNRDQSRIAFRAGIVESINSTKRMFYYVKSYWYISLILIVAPAFSDQFFFWRACLAALILTAALLLLIGYYARRYRQLVEYDIDSFIWDRCYNAHRELAVLVLRTDATQAPPAFEGLRLIAARRSLKLSWSELFS